MKRFISAILCLIVCVVLHAGNASAADQEPFVVHFVVISTTEDDPRLREFKKVAITMAGGYTELGATSGGSMDGGAVKQRDNVSFIIGSKNDISKELKLLTKSLFGGDGAFVLSWPGKVLF